MKHVGLFEAKTKLSELCQQVFDSHEPVLITRRGKPLVRIAAVEEEGRGSSIWKASDKFRRQRKIQIDLELPKRKAAPEKPVLEFK